MPKLAAIARFPLKGFNADPLESIALEAGKTLPLDRKWAIENGGGEFDPDDPKHFPKRYFLMLNGQAEVAKFETKFDADTKSMTVGLADGSEISIAMDDPATHAGLFAHLESELGSQVRGPLRIISAPEQAMTDIPEPQISLINAASVSDLGAKIGGYLDPVRFRGNLVIDDAEPWAEFDWIGREVTVGGARLRVARRIERCAATSVNPRLAIRDINVPTALMQHYQHRDCGVYLDVVEGGMIEVGNDIIVAD